MVVIIRSISPRYRRAGIAFSSDGAPFVLLDSEEDKVGEPGEPIGIGRKTYAVLREEVKVGRLSIMPEEGAEPAAAAISRIAELQQQLAVANARIAELEAELEASEKPRKK